MSLKVLKEARIAPPTNTENFLSLGADICTLVLEEGSRDTTCGGCCCWMGREEATHHYHQPPKPSPNSKHQLRWACIHKVSERGGIDNG